MIEKSGWVIFQVTELSESNVTHELLQTCMDLKVDLVPIEFGFTHNR